MPTPSRAASAGWSTRQAWPRDPKRVSFVPAARAPAGTRALAWPVASGRTGPCPTAMASPLPRGPRVRGAHRPGSRLHRHLRVSCRTPGSPSTSRSHTLTGPLTTRYRSGSPRRPGRYPHLGPVHRPACRRLSAGTPPAQQPPRPPGFTGPLFRACPPAPGRAGRLLAGASDTVAERVVAIGFIPDRQAHTARLPQLAPVAQAALEDHVVVRELTHRIAKVSERARTRMT